MLTSTDSVNYKMENLSKDTFVYIIIVKSTFGSVLTIKRSKGASAAWARGDVMVKILNKCILSI